MYATLEADIRKGRVVLLEPERLPKSGHALLVILEQPAKKNNWRAVRSRLGWLQSSLAPVKWQRAVRDEWNSRS